MGLSVYNMVYPDRFELWKLIVAVLVAAAVGWTPLTLMRECRGSLVTNLLVRRKRTVVCMIVQIIYHFVCMYVCMYVDIMYMCGDFERTLAPNANAAGFRGFFRQFVR